MYFGLNLMPSNKSYSYLNELTGLVSAALIAWELTAISAMHKAARPEKMNVHILRSIL